MDMIWNQKGSLSFGNSPWILQIVIIFTFTLNETKILKKKVLRFHNALQILQLIETQKPTFAIFTIECCYTAFDKVNTLVRLK